MANKAAFTAEEWNQVLGSVFMAGFAVTAADPSGLWGLLKETYASGRALVEAKSSGSELSKAIVGDMETSEGRSAAQDYVKSRLQGAKGEEIKQRALAALQSAVAVIDAKAPSEAAGYKLAAPARARQGRPVPRQQTTSCPSAVRCHVSSRWPSATDRQPFLAALVASSCRATAIVWVTSGSRGQRVVRQRSREAARRLGGSGVHALDPEA